MSVKDIKGSVIIYGIDDQIKTRAARFVEKDAKVAAKIAIQLKLNIWTITTPTLPQLVSKVPMGNPAAVGWNTCSKISRAQFEAVLQAATLDNPARKETVPVISDQDKVAVKGQKPSDLAELERQILAVAHERQNGRLPASWSAVKEGCVVLVQESRDDGWWEGYVVQRMGNMLKLQWRDNPLYGTFIRHISSVALMDPKPI